MYFHLQVGVGPVADVVLSALILIFAAAVIFGIITGLAFCVVFCLGGPPNLLGGPPVAGIVLGGCQVGGGQAIAGGP